MYNRMLDLKTEFPIMYVHARPTYKLNVPAYEITANNMQDSSYGECAKTLLLLCIALLASVDGRERS